MYIRTFNRVLAAAVSATWAVIPTPSIGASLTCTSGTFSATPDGSGNIVVNCTQAGSTPSASCSISGPTSIGVGGGPITLNLSGAGCGTATVSGGKSVQSAGGSTWMDNIPANTLATAVTWTYSAPNANPFTITQAGTGSTGGGTGGSTDVASACAAAGYNSVQQYEMGWANSKVTTKGFNISNVAVFHFRTPPQIDQVDIGKINGAEYATGPRKRHAVMSTSPCDFAQKLSPLGLWSYQPYSDSVAPIINFRVGGVWDISAIRIEPNTDYYFNVKNDPIACSPGANCDMFMELSKPYGL